MRKTFLALLLAASVTPALAQEKTFELKISHWVPASHPLQKSLEDWGAAVEKASGGTLHYKVFPAQQLGKAFDHYDMARDGIADVTYVNPGYQPGRFPIIGAGELPFLMSDAKGGSEALDAWYRKYAEKEMKDVKFCLAFIHSPSSFHSRTKKIVVPDDIKGMKIRPAHATMANFVTLLGGTNVQSSAPEVRDIIERGVADGVTFPWGSLVLFGIDKVTKYHMDAPLYVTTFAFVINGCRSSLNLWSERIAVYLGIACAAVAFILASWGLAQGASAGPTRPTISASFDTTSNPPVLKVSVGSSDVPRSEHLTATVWGKRGGGWIVLGHLITGPTRDGANNANITVNNIMPYSTIVINALLSSEDIPLALTPPNECSTGMSCFQIAGFGMSSPLSTTTPSK